jgi:hypothetical protein
MAIENREVRNANVIIDRAWHKAETRKLGPLHGHTSSVDKYSPMERWENESAFQQPYHNIYSVGIGSYRTSAVNPAKQQGSSVGYLNLEDKKN